MSVAHLPLQPKSQDLSVKDPGLASLASQGARQGEAWHGRGMAWHGMAWTWTWTWEERRLGVIQNRETRQKPETRDQRPQGGDAASSTVRQVRQVVRFVGSSLGDPILHLKEDTRAGQ
jgi:hypothetical protein